MMETQQQALLGILGGMGPLATVDFLGKLTRLTPAARDQDHLPWVTVSQPGIPDRSAAIKAGNDGPGPFLVKGAAWLATQGTKLIAIPCNTSHFWFEQMQAASSVPILHIADATIEELQRSEGPIGAIAILVIPILVSAQHGTDAAGIQAVGWFLMVMSPLTIALVTLRTPEPAVRRATVRLKLSDYAALLARPNVLRVLLSDFCVILGPGWMSALYLFFFTDSRGFTTSAANGLLVIYIAAGLIGAPATAWLANRINKHRAFMVTTTGYSLMLVFLFLVPKGDFLLAAPCMFIAGAFAAGSIVMIRSITADVSDEIRLENGQEQIGLLYALTSGTTKAAGAFAVFLTFWVLSLVGYDPSEHAVNGPDQIRGLDLAYIIGPTVFVMLGGACFFGYRMTETRHAEIRRQLDERDALYDEAAIVEAVSGTSNEVVLPAP